MMDWCVFDEWLTDVEANMTFGGQESPCPSCPVSQSEESQPCLTEPASVNWFLLVPFL